MRFNKAIMALLIFVVMAVSAWAVVPSMDTIPAKNVLENQPLSFVVTSAYSGTDTLTYTTGTLPAGATFNAATQTFTWTPTYTQNGTYVVAFNVYELHNASSSDTKNATITVIDVPRAPTVSAQTVTIASDNTQQTASISANDPDGNSVTYSVAQALNTSVAQCYIDDASANTIRVTRGSDDIKTATKTTTCVVTVQDNANHLQAQATFTVSVAPISKLAIDKNEVTVGTDSQTVDNDDTFDVKPGDALSFKIKVENLYTGDTDAEDVAIKSIDANVDIEDWNDGDNQDWDNTKDINLNAGRTGTLDVKIDSVPTDISEGDHTVTIKVTGRDQKSSVKYTVTWTATMNVQKDSEDITMSGLTLEPASVSCDRTATLSVRITNSGTDDSNDILFEAKNTQLGISILDTGLDLNEGDSVSKTYPITVSKTMAAGTYPIRVSTYFDSDRYDNKDVSNTNTVTLTVSKCEDTVPVVTPPVVTPPKENVTVITPPVVTPEPVTPVKTTGFLGLSDTTIMVGLVVLNILLIVGIVVVIGNLLSRK